MTDKEKIGAEIERLKRWNDNVRESTRHMTVQEVMKASVRNRGTLAQRRWLNRSFIWPQRKVNRLIVRHDMIMRIAIIKLRQWGTAPRVYAMATRIYRQLKAR